VHVPYRGAAPGMTDVISGQVQAFVITVSTASGFIKSGKVRPLAVTGAARTDVLPDIPSVSEVLPGFNAVTWNGMCAPKGTPAGVIDTLNSNVSAALADPQLKERFKNLGGETQPMSPAEFGRFLDDETQKWAKAVKFSGAKAD
jgi:tripartite-type tricarboxylate transporter receptor subunit TctC